MIRGVLCGVRQCWLHLRQMTFHAIACRFSLLQIKPNMSGKYLQIASDCVLLQTFGSFVMRLRYTINSVPVHVANIHSSLRAHLPTGGQ